MKKGLSNSEQWSRRLGYALTVLVLIDCIVPFTWNAWRRRPSNGQTTRRSLDPASALNIVDALGKLANGKSSWRNNEFGLESGFEEDGWNKFGLKSGSEKLSGVQLPDEVFRRNLSVFILPDLRRTANGNENVAAVASNQELSLQDSDAIDFYWRQDIDAEKGQYPALWSPDLQYERDVQLVTEKTLMQPGITDQNVRYIPDQNDFIRELLQSQKEHFGSFDALPTSSAVGGGAKSGGWQTEKAPYVFEQAITQHQQQPAPTDNAYGGALQNLDLDWLNASNVDPMNDVFLDPSHLPNGGYNAEQGLPGSEYNFLSVAGNDLNTPPTSMDWEPRAEAQAAATAIDSNRADQMLLDELFASGEFDNLPTPDLFLAPNDVASIFGNRQVVQDVAEAQTTKDLMLNLAPIATVDAFPTATGSDVLAYVPAGFDEDQGDQTEALLESLTPYNDPYSIPAASWQPTAPAVPSWHPQPAADTGALSVSPTWSGDHDYTFEASGRDSTSRPTEWSHSEEFTVKSEPGTYYDDDDEDVDEEDSGELQARAASERDEVRARHLNLPFTAAEIVTMSQQDYVSLTRSKGRFTREQIELIKEIRRHGGNKEAARRSRQKKVQMSKQLEDEVSALERERDAIMAEYRKLLREVAVEDRAVEDLKRKNRK